MKYALLVAVVSALTLTACEYKKHPMDKPPPSAMTTPTRSRISTSLTILRLMGALAAAQAAQTISMKITSPFSAIDGMVCKAP